MTKQPRPYRQVARAAATDGLRQRVVAAFDAAMRDRMMDDITLDQIANAAGTTRQTVIRLFGGKDGLVEAFVEQFGKGVIARRVLASTATHLQVTEVLFEDYEEVGDFVIRMLAQESRHPVLSIWHDIGRAFHRQWIANSFAAVLPAEPAARAMMIDHLVIVGDVYTWKLLRRDFKLPASAARSTMASMFLKTLRED